MWKTLTSLTVCCGVVISGVVASHDLMAGIAEGAAERALRVSAQREALAAYSAAEATAEILLEKGPFVLHQSPLMEPYAGDVMVEKEDSAALSTTVPWKVCSGLSNCGLKSWACVLEEAESDQVIFRGGAAVTSSDGLQYCTTCRLGAVPAGDSREAYLLATSGTPTVRCTCGCN